MKPQEKYKAARCFGLPEDVFDLLYESLQSESRFVDIDLDNPHFLLFEGGNRRVCFYQANDGVTEAASVSRNDITIGCPILPSNLDMAIWLVYDKGRLIGRIGITGFDLRNIIPARLVVLFNSRLEQLLMGVNEAFDEKNHSHS